MFRRTVTFLIAAKIFVGIAIGQDVEINPCEEASADTILHGNDVRARILNNGGLFWKGSPHVYNVPAFSPPNAIFAAGLWVGGLVDGELRLAATRYGSWEFWPGPMGSDPATCEKYDRIYSIRSEDLDRYSQTGEASPDMLDWPWEVGAPVTDGDGVPGNYNLAGGDVPELLGDHRLWWIMNDAGGEHESTDTKPLGMEVRASAFATDYDLRAARMTFYRYELTYRGNKRLEDARLSFFVDSDLGNFQDDYVGSDTTLGMGYVYNADNEDEGGEGYGTAPPAIGIVFLDAPVAYRAAQAPDGSTDPRRSSFMTSMIYFLGGGGDTQGDPNTATEYHNFMRAWWGTGEAMTEGGTGLGFSEQETKFAFPGEPGAFWSEPNNDGNGSPNTPSDRRIVLNNGPFEMDPGDTVTFYFGIVFSRGDDHLDSVRELKKDAGAMKRVAPALLQPAPREVPDPPEPPKFTLGANDVYPNPATDQVAIEFSLPRPMQVRLEVFDVLGRRVLDGARGTRDAGEYTERFNVSDWPAGVYTVRLQIDRATSTQTFVVTR